MNLKTKMNLNLNLQIRIKINNIIELFTFSVNKNFSIQ